MMTKDRDRALYRILINEGWPQEHVVDLIATCDSSKLDELLAKYMADPRRQHDVEIIPPDQLSDGVVDFNAQKIQAANDRHQKESDAEEAHQQRVRDQLSAVMEASELESFSLIEATLGPLLEVLQAEGTAVEEVKKNIVMVLNVFCDD